MYESEPAEFSSIIVNNVGRRKMRRILSSHTSFSQRMFADHLPWMYEQAIERAIANPGQRE